jgi:hypothetical protein
VVAATAGSNERLRSGKTIAAATSKGSAKTTRIDLITAPFMKWNTSAGRQSRTNCFSTPIRVTDADVKEATIAGELRSLRDEGERSVQGHDA